VRLRAGYEFGGIAILDVGVQVSWVWVTSITTSHRTSKDTIHLVYNNHRPSGGGHFSQHLMILADMCLAGTFCVEFFRTLVTGKHDVGWRMSGVGLDVGNEQVDKLESLDVMINIHLI